MLVSYGLILFININQIWFNMPARCQYVVVEIKYELSIYFHSSVRLWQMFQLIFPFPFINWGQIKVIYY